MKIAPVILENYNPKWKDAFNKMKAQILSVLLDVRVMEVMVMGTAMLRRKHLKDGIMEV